MASDGYDAAESHELALDHLHCDRRPQVRLALLFRDARDTDELNRRHIGRLIAALLGPPHVLVGDHQNTPEPRPSTLLDAILLIARAYGLTVDETVRLHGDYTELYASGSKELSPEWAAAVRRADQVRARDRGAPAWHEFVFPVIEDDQDY